MQVPFAVPAGIDRWLQRRLFFNTTRGFFLEVGAGGAGSTSAWFEARREVERCADRRRR
jgi:hypothetical protein